MGFLPRRKGVDGPGPIRDQKKSIMNAVMDVLAKPLVLWGRVPKTMFPSESGPRNESTWGPSWSAVPIVATARWYSMVNGQSAMRRTWVALLELLHPGTTNWHWETIPVVRNTAVWRRFSTFAKTMRSPSHTTRSGDAREGLIYGRWWLKRMAFLKCLEIEFGMSTY